MIHTSVEVFQRDKELFLKWQAIASSYDFARVLGFARASLLESDALTAEEMHCVNKLATVLATLCDVTESAPVVPSSGLRRDVDIKPRTLPLNQA